MGGIELVVLVLGLSAVALASNNHGQFHGRYGGRCDRDGFYYKDQGSMVICSNNNAYVQPCAPGTRNSAFNSYNRGGHYHYRDFCDVNLVDYGYGVRHGGYGHSGNTHGHSGGYGGSFGGSYGGGASSYGGGHSGSHGHSGGGYGHGVGGRHGGHAGGRGGHGGHSGYGGNSYGH